jgi:predicted Zn-dependent protease
MSIKPIYHRSIIFSLVALILVGCASEAIVPILPEKSEIVAAPAPPRIDPTEQREHKRLLAAFGGHYNHVQAQALVDDVIVKLSPATDQPSLHYRVTILNSPSINAFALPNGSIYITRGLLTLANSTSEIGSVISHEMAHITARHAVARAQLERRATLVSRVNADLLNDPEAGQTRQNEGRVAIASFSRQQELEADQVGVRIMAKAGFDPYAATRFLKSLERSSLLRGVSAPKNSIDFLSTHPSTPERIEAALQAARQLSAASNISSEKEQKDHNRYLGAINGMAFGDDPVEGVIDGTHFSHPRLGFSFHAPDGFVLKNTSIAVLGFKDNNQQALRFETVRIANNTSLTDYLKKSPVEGAPTSKIEPLQISGFEAATAIANSNEWTYRFAIIRAGERSYRMILAAQNFTPEVDRQFLASVSSFRKLTQVEAQNIRAQKITTLIAQSNDTAASLSARMVGEQKIERFLVLNGLGNNDELKAGTRYKIIE